MAIPLIADHRTASRMDESERWYNVVGNDKLKVSKRRCRLLNISRPLEYREAKYRWLTQKIAHGIT